MKYLLDEGLKRYKIPLPPVLSQRIARRNTEEEEKKHLTESISLQTFQLAKEEKGKKPT